MVYHICYIYTCIVQNHIPRCFSPFSPPPVVPSIGVAFPAVPQGKVQMTEDEAALKELEAMMA